MGFTDDLYDNKNFIGTIFFILSIIIIAYLFIIPVNHLVIHIDEHFTLGLIQLPLNDALNILINQAQPPLYYLILFGGLKLLSIAKISYNILFACKIISLLSYILIVILTLTKIRKKYNMLTAGIFLFSLSTTSSFLVEFITVRMYGWSVLFLLLAFLYYTDILEKSNTKNWILFTIFTLLSAYTHYYLLIPILIIYLSYPIYIYLRKTLNNKKELKKWIYSLITGIILYMPCIYIAVTNTSHQIYKLTLIDANILLNYFTYFILRQTSTLTIQLYYKILIALFFVLLVIIFITQAKKLKITQTYTVFSGINIYLFTILIGILVMIVTHNILTERYILAAIAIFWLAISLLIGEMKNKTLLILALLFIIVFGTLGFMMTTDYMNNQINKTSSEDEILNNLNNQDSVIIYNSSFYYNCYHYRLNNTIEYSLIELPYAQGYTTEANLTKILEDNPDKNVYLWKTVQENQQVVPDTIEYEKVCGRGDIWLINIYPSNATTDNSTA